MALIDRETALKAIDEIVPIGETGVLTKSLCYAALKSAMMVPTIDAVPVTRCRDCTRHKVEMVNGAECWRCPLRELDVGPDYYCADGVRE